MKAVAHIRTGFHEKFGVPRQSGLVKSAIGTVVFEPEYRRTEALEGLEEYSHIWILWDFSMSHQDEFVPMVHPPRLGGRQKKGVWATRSPFRPNSIGLSCVKIEQIIKESELGPQIIVSGIDMVDNTPIYDIKPYLPYTDCIMGARGSFGEQHSGDRVQVICDVAISNKVTSEIFKEIADILAQDPRAAYNKTEDYVYGMSYDKYDVRFTVAGGILTIIDIVELNGELNKIK